MFKSIFNKKSTCLTVLFLFLAVTMSNLTCWAASAGYSLFFVPGDEDLLSAVLDELDNATDETTHCVIGITNIINFSRDIPSQTLPSIWSSQK